MIRRLTTLATRGFPGGGTGPNHHRRGFALPLVLLLGFLVAITGTLMLELQASTTLATQRQVNGYKAHHRSVGYRDMIDQWLLIAGEDLQQRLTPEGLAFTLELPNGRSAFVYMEDAQGTVLRSAGRLAGDQATRASQIADELARVVGLPTDPRAAPYFRGLGPAEISVRAASPEVLRAVFGVLGKEQRAEAFSRELESVRNLENFGLGRITQAGTQAGLTQQEAEKLGEMLTARPRLWRVVVEVDARTIRGVRLVERAEGLIEIPTKISLGEPGVTVLRWEEERVDAY